MVSLRSKNSITCSGSLLKFRRGLLTKSLSVYVQEDGESGRWTMKNIDYVPRIETGSQEREIHGVVNRLFLWGDVL